MAAPGSEVPMHITVRIKGRPGQTFAALRGLGDMEGILSDVWRSAKNEPSIEVVLGEHSYLMTRDVEMALTGNDDTELQALRSAYEKDCRKALRAKARKAK